MKSQKPIDPTSPTEHSKQATQIRPTLHITFQPLLSPPSSPEPPLAPFHRQIKIPSALQSSHFKQFKNFLIKQACNLPQTRDRFKRIDIVAERGFNMYIDQHTFGAYLQALEEREELRFLRVEELSSDRETLKYEKGKGDISEDEGSSSQQRSFHYPEIIKDFIRDERRRRNVKLKDIMDKLPSFQSGLTIKQEYPLSSSFNSDGPIDEFIGSASSNILHVLEAFDIIQIQRERSDNMN